MEEKTTVLIIDDEPYITMLIDEFLKLRGYTVYTASDGNEGLRVFNEKKPSIIILDIKMPGLQGDKVKALIEELNPKAQIILTSGHLEVEGLSLKADDMFLKKPFNMRDLLNILKEAEKRLAEDIV